MPLFIASRLALFHLAACMRLGFVRLSSCRRACRKSTLIQLSYIPEYII